MAQVINENQIKLNSGQVVQAKQGGWYDAQQFWGGTLSAPGQINALSNQVGAGQQVSNEVIAQTNPANVAYVQQQRQNYQPSMPTAPVQPTMQKSAPVTNGGNAGADLNQIIQPQTINLPQLYESLYSSSGIRDIEADLNAKTMAYNEKVAEIKNNPYLSEATMTGRISKLDEKFRADTQAIQNNIAMKKADIETQLNLQTKQFDIESEASQRALSQFNTLLNAGALDNASGEDIANFTRATGIPSSMIQSAIQVSKKSKEKEANTQIIQYDDGINQGFVVINQNTGEILNNQTVAQSKPRADSGGTVTDRTASDHSSVIQIINDYLTNKGRQAQISPEDLFRELINAYPLAYDFILNNYGINAQKFAESIRNNPSYR